MPAYVRLLRDNEAEVRIAAAGKVTKFCRILSPQLAIQHILPCVKVFADKICSTCGCMMNYIGFVICSILLCFLLN